MILSDVLTCTVFPLRAESSLLKNPILQMRGGAHITMQVIASVEKYENAGMKFSTVPAFALAESRASDACCLFLVQKHTRAKLACFPPQESSDQVLELIADVATHSLDPRAATRAVPVRNLPAAAHAALL